MVRFVYTLLYIWISILVIGCNGESTSLLGGDREASISIMPVSKEFTLTVEDPKKLVMVIIADPTGSMASTVDSVRRSIPGFTQGLIDTGFDFDIYCSNTSYNGGDSQIISYRSSSSTTASALQQALTDCIDVDLTQVDVGDERGLEAAKKTWENILAKGYVSREAVKLTLIVTNEDDCSRDLGQYPSGAEHNCIDQNVSFSPVQGPNYGKAFPMTDTAYADDTRLFPSTRYVDFFQERLNYVSTTARDELDEVLIQRGHIFAPVIMPPPAAVGREAAERCKDIKTQIGIANGNKVMSYGMRYYQVAEASNNSIYSLCDEFASIFDEINTSVQNEVKERKFILSRKPSNPESLQIQIRRNISDVSLASSILQRMEYENSRVSESNKWVKTEEKEARIGNKNVITQKWSRTLNYGVGFTYRESTNELVFDDSIYQPYNDKLRVVSYAPAGLDGEVNYGE